MGRTLYIICYMASPFYMRCGECMKMDTIDRWNQSQGTASSTFRKYDFTLVSSAGHRGHRPPTNKVVEQVY